MSNSRDVVIVDGTRTPFAKAGTKLKEVHPAELGRIALKELIDRANLDTRAIDEVIVGNTGNPPDSVNISRVIALNAGVPQATSAYTVHRNCASALESISSGYEKIKSGTMDIVLAGGTESMSQMPLLFTKQFQDIFGEIVFAKTLGQRVNAIKKFKFNYLKPRVSIMEGLRDPFSGLMMGDTAEIIAKEFNISRQDQDEFAKHSHDKAIAAQKAGKFEDEIVPVFLAPKYKDTVTNDNGPREEQSLEKLGRFKPYFDRKSGTITVANACPITDGAAMLLMMSREKAESLGYKPLAKIRSYAFAGLEPERMGLGPVYATPVALKRAGLEMKDIDLVELNEAFAAQVIGCQKAFASDKFGQEKLGLSKALGEIDPEKMNVNGGAVAIGHPVGATGTRLVVTLMKEMARRNVQFGLATLCIGGGQGGAMVLEREG